MMKNDTVLACQTRLLTTADHEQTIYILVEQERRFNHTSTGSYDMYAYADVNDCNL